MSAGDPASTAEEGEKAEGGEKNAEGEEKEAAAATEEKGEEKDQEAAAATKEKGEDKDQEEASPPDPSAAIAELTAKATMAASANSDNLCAKNLLDADVQSWMTTLNAEQVSQLALCAKSGLDNVDSGLGCYAVDPKNYDEFAMFFDKVCEDYHHGGGKVHTTNWSLEGVKGLPEGGVLDLGALGLPELSMRARSVLLV